MNVELLLNKNTLRRISFFVVILFCTFANLFHEPASAQRRTQRRPPTPRIDYSKFSHATEKHREACNTCHKSPTRNWQRVREFPDIADYPDHEACVSCHRQQFFRGTKPVICSNCHVKISPRGDERFAFRHPSRSHQFTIEFPHDKHQDVIAKLSPETSKDRFLRVSFSSPHQPQTQKARTYNNCTICHDSNTREPVAPKAGWPDNFVPIATMFKTVPVSHESCFNCHWQAQKPVANDCGGCHKLATSNLPVGWPERISLKFTHAREQHVAECTSCHINITRAVSVIGLKPDVPITACTECHNKEGLREDLNKELVQLDQKRDFACSYCHVTTVGRLDPPASHYLVAGRAPLKRKDIK